MVDFQDAGEDQVGSVLPSRENAAARRDVGIERAVDRADRDSPGWADAALFGLEKYCLAHPGAQFLGEQVREWAEGCGLVEAPENGRAWGAVLRKASRMDIIKKVGFAPARSSNLSPKCLWEPVTSLRQKQDVA